MINESYEEDLRNIGRQVDKLNYMINESINNNDDNLVGSSESYISPLRRTPEEINDDRASASSTDKSEIRDENRPLPTFQYTPMLTRTRSSQRGILLGKVSLKIYKKKCWKFPTRGILTFSRCFSTF